MACTGSGLLRLGRILRSGGADDAKPRWTLPSKDYLKYTYQPSIPDKHFYGAHWNYAPITMWVRARRPGMEKIGLAMFGSAQRVWHSATSPVAAFVHSHTPGALQKAVAFFAAWLTFSFTVRSVYGQETEAWMTMDKLHSYAEALRLEQAGFWRTEAEDRKLREDAFNDTCVRLKGVFDDALVKATKENSFAVLAAAVSDFQTGPEVDRFEEEMLISAGGSTWRFGLMPYGRDNADSRVFSVPKDETNGGAYQFMDVANYGDYIDRVDSKGEPLRKTRNLFASAYIAPTK